MIPLRWKIAAIAIIAFILGMLRWRSVSVARALAKLEAEQQKAHIETRRRMDNAAQNAPADAGRAREWLRNRKPGKR